MFAMCFFDFNEHSYTIRYRLSGFLTEVEMISWFTENSLIPLVTGTFLVLAFLGLAISAREKTMLFVAMIVAALTAGIVITETLVVTDREAVTEIVYSLAQSVEANDMESVLSHVSPDREDAKERIRNEMPKYSFDTVRVIGIADFSSTTDLDPKQAAIDFAVMARGREKAHGQGGHVQRRVQLKFQKGADGQWRMIDYSHSGPRSGVNL
jgi:hypothetical protein